MTQLVLMPPRAAEMNDPVSLVGRLLPAAGGLERGRSLRQWRGLRLEWIQQGAQSPHAGGSCAGSDAHTQDGTTGQVRHDRNNAALTGHYQPSHAELEALCDLA